MSIGRHAEELAGESVGSVHVLAHNNIIIDGSRARCPSHLYVMRIDRICYKYELHPRLTPLFAVYAIQVAVLSVRT